ncbi:hypothetical protein FS837_011038 [Tulasnella sp. UAMH 9824]|nr:hypothetical protein FS837_011038 [Tulasnella sp. UAMH 9824]
MKKRKSTLDTDVKDTIKAKVSALSIQIVETRRLLQSLPDPETPRDCIQNEIAALQSIFDEVQSQISARKTRQNELLPIHRLPVEVLAIILSTALLPLGRYHRRRTRLLLVCRTWANTINTNPSTFWTTLSTDDPPGQHDRLLQMSRQMPVTVFMNYQGRSRPSKKLMDAVRPNGLALRAMVFTGYDGEPIKEVLTDCLVKPGPHLESLDIAVSCGGGWALQTEDSKPQHAQTNFVAGPNLRSVRFCRVYIPWSAAILRGLRSLSLEYLGRFRANKKSPTLSQLVGILHDCPDLRALKLRYITFSPEDQPAAPTMISLKALREINLSGRYLRSICDILQYIQYPGTAAVSIGIRDLVIDDWWQEDLGVALLPLTQNRIIAPLHLKIKRPHLTLSAENFRLRIPCPNEERGNKGPQITYKELFSSLGDPILGVVTSLHMDSSASQNSTAILTAANEHFPNLTKLSISPYQRLKSKKPWHVVLEKVTQPAEEVNRPTFLCPKLTSLKIAIAHGDYPDLLSILQLVRTRTSDKKSKGKRVEKSPITAISMNLETGKLPSEQLGLLNELKREVDNVICTK